MKARKLRRVVKKRVGHIKRCNAEAIHADQEAVHQLRVEYKKLRAFIRLARLVPSSKKELKIPARLKQVYKRAGDLRSLQMYYDDTVLFFNPQSIYLAEILWRIEMAKYNLLEYIDRFHFTKALKRLKKHLPSRLHRKQLEKFVEKKTSSINELSGHIMSANDQHKIRKYLKDILYDRKLFHGDTRHLFPIANINDSRQLDGIIDLLGKHQDYVTGLSLLNASLRNGVSSSDKSILTNIQKEWKLQENRLRENIASRIS